MSEIALIYGSQIICKEPGRYIGWPTITKTQDGQLLVVFSGDRDEHVCPWGKTQLVRSRDGVEFTPGNPPVHAVFVLMGSADERNYHLRALMAIAEIVQDGDFDSKWRRARGIEGLRRMVLGAERRREG